MKQSTNSTAQPSRRKYTDEERKLRASASRKKWRAKNPQAHLDRHLKSRYGISRAQRDHMLADQGGVCAVCGSDTPQKGGQDWVVDHCHASGKVRGILCHPCNAALGLFRDNSHTLAQAIHYLEKHNG